jgi:hypothetical protein
MPGGDLSKKITLLCINAGKAKLNENSQRTKVMIAPFRLVSFFAEK